MGDALEGGTAKRGLVSISPILASPECCLTCLSHLLLPSQSHGQHLVQALCSGPLLVSLLPATVHLQLPVKTSQLVFMLFPCPVQVYWIVPFPNSYVKVLTPMWLVGDEAFKELIKVK